MIHHLIQVMVYITVCTVIEQSIIANRFPKVEVDDCKIIVLNTSVEREKSSFSIKKLKKFELNAFNRTFMLTLYADDKFLSNRFLSQRLSGGKAWLNTTNKNLGCFYTGFVNDNSQRTVSVSICHGMLGTFHIYNQNYYIQPKFVNASTELIGHTLTRQNHGSLNVSDACEAIDAQDANHYEKQNFSFPQTFNTKRVRRDMSRPFYLEVLVVTDYSMFKFHEDDLKVYVLTLMASVANLYRQASIGVAIEVTLVRHYMIQDPNSHPVVTNNALETLHNFCKWQSSLNTLDTKNPLHYDAAVLLTRKDLCRERCNTLGVAELNGLCNLSTSCAVIEDNGLATGFTIAHELAHLFGVRHDGDKICVQRGLTETNLMATSLTFAHNHWQWSDCSRYFFGMKLQSADLSCLKNKPSNIERINGDQAHMMQYPPGFYYPVNDQCEKAFGPGYTYCPFQSQPFCKYLFCCRSDQNGTFCATNHATVADGTPCTDASSANSVCSVSRCLHGDCVCWYDRAPIEGQWGPWGPYGVCSRTCGGGIQKRYRECSNPSPANGGRYCVGRSVGFRTCNIEKCPSRYIEYRQLQCSKFDGQTFGHIDLPANVRWVPKYEVMENERCRLICQVQDDRKERSVVISEAVEDGTKCGPEDETTDICIGGRCIPIGCDNQYDSEGSDEIKVADMCGVCGGDNSTCEKFSKRLIKDDYGFQLVYRIPTGASNMEIKQVSARRGQRDKNYLVLKGSDGRESVINSEQSFSTRRRVVKYKSTLFEYTGTETHIERINCTKVLKSPVTLYVMKADVARMIIDIEYWLENRSRRIFRWVQNVEKRYTPACSRICNGVRKVGKYVCKERYQTVNDDRCNSSSKPRTYDEPCNTDCFVSWVQFRYSPCSARCGPGYRDAQFTCRLDSKENGTHKLIDNSHCVEAVGPEPSLSVQCTGDCTESGWMFSKWSRCQQQSGQCMKTRNATCIDERGIEAHESLCQERYKITREACGSNECERGRWTAGAWSKCDCRTQVQKRSLVCSGSGGRLIGNHKCPKSKPITVKNCSKNCEKPKWIVGQWSNCPVTCENSWRIRSVRCATQRRIVADYACSHLPKPIDIEACLRPICTQWTMGDWSQCHCPDQIRKRNVSCTNFLGLAIPLHHCNPQTMPSSIEKCSNQCDIPKWVIGRWTRCSVSCGTGIRRRGIKCFLGKRQAPVEYCQRTAKPIDTEFCVKRSCRVRWQTSNWEPCSKKCGNGTQLRTFNCLREGLSVSPSACHHLSKPSAVRECIGQQCTPWNVGKWKPCSVSCGRGFETRTVRCPMGHECNPSLKPLHARKCIGKNCQYGWTTGSWSECFGKCGEPGVRSRMVRCVAKSLNRTVSPLRCSKHSPQTTEYCEIRDCGTWFTGEWSKCSANCGRTGVQTRHVYCLGDNRVLSTTCNLKSKPEFSRVCSGSRCLNKTVWKTGPFAKCNETCGRREIWCSEGGHTIISSNHCNPNNRPVEVKHCPATCRSVTRWKYSSWQPCKEVNNHCVRLREATCIGNSGITLNPIHCSGLVRKISSPCKCAHWRTIGNLTCLCKGISNRSQLKCVLPTSKRITSASNCKQIRSLKSNLPQCPMDMCTA